MPCSSRPYHSSGNTRSWSLLGGTNWKPLKGLFGYLPFISSTFWVTLLALLIAVPPCMLTAIYLSEYASSTLRSVMKPILDLLAAIPSVIYGVWGMLVIVPWVQDKVIPFCRQLSRAVSRSWYPTTRPGSASCQVRSYWR